MLVTMEEVLVDVVESSTMSFVTMYSLIYISILLLLIVSAEYLAVLLPYLRILMMSKWMACIFTTMSFPGEPLGMVQYLMA